jgi:hypothetical protein
VGENGAGTGDPASGYSKALRSDTSVKLVVD